MAGFRQSIHPQVEEKILSLTRAGVRRVHEMRRHVKEFVVNDMFRGQQAPDECRRRFFPLREDYRNIMKKAKTQYKNAIVSTVL